MSRIARTYVVDDLENFASFSPPKTNCKLPVE